MIERQTQLIHMIPDLRGYTITIEAQAGSTVTQIARVAWLLQNAAGVEVNFIHNGSLHLVALNIQEAGVMVTKEILPSKKEPKPNV